MEEQHVKLSQEEYLAQLSEVQDEAKAPVEQEAAKPEPAAIQQPRKRSPYRYWALLLAGVLCFALLILLAALVWGSLLFSRLGDVGDSVYIPLAIFLGAVFLSCALVTLLSRGGTIFPALGLAVIVNILPFLLMEAGMPQPQLKDILIKLGYTLLAAVAGFVISKMLYIRSKR